MASVEEKVEDFYKDQLNQLGIRHYSKTEIINRTIDDALKAADSKSGNIGNNYPDKVFGDTYDYNMFMEVLFMCKNKPKNERFEKILEEHKDDPEAMAILKSNWMKQIMAEVEDNKDNE